LLQKNEIVGREFRAQRFAESGIPNPKASFFIQDKCSVTTGRDKSQGETGVLRSDWPWLDICFGVVLKDNSNYEDDTTAINNELLLDESYLYHMCKKLFFALRRVNGMLPTRFLP